MMLLPLFACESQVTVNFHIVPRNGEAQTMASDSGQCLCVCQIVYKVGLLTPYHTESMVYEHCVNVRRVWFLYGRGSI